MKILPIESILGLLESEEGTKFIEKLFKIFSKEKRLMMRMNYLIELIITLKIVLMENLLMN